MPQISATVRQPVIDKIKELAEKEQRSFSDMVAILLENSFTLNVRADITGSDLLLHLNRINGTSNKGGDQSSPSVQ